MTLAVVQSTGIQSVGTVASLAKAFSSNVTGGNLIVVGSVVVGSVQPAGGCTDSIGNTYSRAVNQAAGTSPGAAVYYSANITGGACTVTVNPTTDDVTSIGISEVSGAATSSVLDVTGTGAANSTTPSTGNMLLGRREIIFGAISHFGSTATTITPDGTYAQQFEDEGVTYLPINWASRIVEPGTYTANWTLSASQLWAVAAAAFIDADPALIPTLVGAGTASFTAATGATLAPGLPSGWAADDIHVLIAHRSDNTAMTALSGWTQISAGNNTAAQRVEVWVRRAVGGDTAPSVTFGTGAVVRGARIIGIRNVPTTIPVSSLQFSRSNNAASATVTFATLTPRDPNNFLLGLYAYEDDPTAATQIENWSTFGISTSTLGNDMALGYAWRPWLTAGTATGALSTTVSGGTFGTSPSVGIIMALTTSKVSLPPLMRRVNRVWRRRVAA